MQTIGPAIWEIRYLLVDALMRSGPVVIGLIFPKGPLELRLVEEQKMVGVLCTKSSG